MLYSQKVRTNTNTKQQEASEVRGTIEVETVHRALPRREPIHGGSVSASMPQRGNALCTAPAISVPRTQFKLSFNRFNQKNF